MTPEAIAARQRVVDAMTQTAGDYSPVRSWTQGAARVAQGVVAGLEEQRINEGWEANIDDEKRSTDLLLANPLLSGGASVAPGVAKVSSAMPVAAAASAPTAADAPEKIYSPGELNPIDYPQGADRDAMRATILGEESTRQGHAGVANVIRSRAVDGGYGGDTPSAVVQAPNQFEPWSTQSGRARMVAALQTPGQVAAADDAIDQAYGTGKYVAAGPNDPTEGKTMFYAPAAQAALGRSAPAWAQGPGQMLGKTAFYDDNSGQPANAQPTQGYAVPGAQPSAPATAPPTAPQIPPETAQYIRQLIANPGTRAAGVALLAQYQKPRETYSQQTDQDGNIWSINNATGQRTIAKAAAEKSTPAQKDFEYGVQHPDFAAAQLAKTKAGATQLNNVGNVDMNSGHTYDKQLAEGLGKSHAALSNGVEEAQTRARDIAGLQGAVDSIQKNGGTTGGMGQQQLLDLKKTINNGPAAVGIDQPFRENDISSKDLMQKLTRQIAGAQAKNAVGSRVTNFEMSNYLKANPGGDVSLTGNQRLLGIQAQIEQRNVAVGNAIRNATAQAISAGQKIDPVTVQRLITTYDDLHHVPDPITRHDR